MTERDERLKEIAERMDKATEGWSLAFFPADEHMSAFYRVERSAGPSIVSGADDDENDMRFIVHARSDIPWLLAKLSAADAENAKLRAQMEKQAQEVADEMEAQTAYVTKLKERLRVMEEALRQCAVQFEAYAAEHIRKGSADKAATNSKFAGIARDALAS